MRSGLSRNEANGLALMVLGVLVAGLAQWYLSNKLPLLDGLVFYTVACFLFVRGAGREYRRAGDALPRGLVLALLGAVFVLALALRFYELSSIPYGLWYDEAAIGLEAARVQSDSSYRPMYSTGTTSPPAYVYLVAVAQELLGQNMAALRTVSALFGALTVLPFYFLGSALFGPAVGLVGAYFIAVSRWDLNFSRIAMQGVTTPLFTTLVVALLLLAMSTRKTPLFIAAGGVLGLGVWFYSAFLVFPAVLAVFLTAVVLEESAAIKRLWRGAVALGIAALILAAPVAVYARAHPEAFFSRINTASAFKDEDLSAKIAITWQNARKHLLMFNYQGDRNGRHNFPGEPMLDPFTGALAVLGLSCALCRWREPVHLLLLAWFGVMLGPGVFSLSFEAPQGLRAIGVIPAVYLLALLALHKLIVGFSRVLAPRYLLFGLALLAVLVGYNELNVFFGKQAKNFASWSVFSTAETIIGKRLAELPEEDYIAQVSPLHHGHPSIKYLAGDRPYSMFDLSNGLPVIPNGKSVALFLSPEEKTAREMVQSYYPEAACQETTSPDPGPPSLVICEITQKDVADAQGVTARYFRTGEGVREAFFTDSEEAVEVGRDLQRQPPVPYRKEWSGSLYVPEYGEHVFSTQGTLRAQLFIDDKLVLNGVTSGGPVVLARGLHLLRATVVVIEPGDLTLQWQRKGAALERVPHQYLFQERIAASGLTGSYYANASWNGPPAFQRVDPAISFYFHILPLQRPYSVEWRGSIMAPETGNYRFATRSIGSSQLYVGERLVVDNAAQDQMQEGALPLERGWRRIRVRFQDTRPYSRVYLHWAPPGKGVEVVPPQYLRPW